MYQRVFALKLWRLLHKGNLATHLKTPINLKNSRFKYI